MSEFKGKNILIIGVTGFIGSNLANEFVSLGANVHGIIREGSDTWRLTEDNGVTLHYGDITDFDDIKQLADKIQPHIIYNLAASKSSSTAISNKINFSIMAAINTAATQNLLEATAHIDYEKFIHIGSASEYGAMDHPIKETDRPEPHTYFGTTKLAGTLSAVQFAKTHNKPVTVLRLFSVYGYMEPKSRFIPRAITGVYEGSAITLAPPGYKHDCVFIEDVVSACLKAALSRKATGEIINIGTGTESTNQDIVDIIEGIVGNNVETTVGEFDPHIYDSFSWIADITKAKETLDWSPQYNLKEGLKKSIASMVNIEMGS